MYDIELTNNKWIKVPNNQKIYYNGEKCKQIQPNFVRYRVNFEDCKFKNCYIAILTAMEYNNFILNILHPLIHCTSHGSKNFIKSEATITKCKMQGDRTFTLLHI